MKQIFDWLREQIGNIDVNDIDVLQDMALEKVDEAEAKWESECCEWKFFKPSNSLYEKHGDFRTSYELEKWSVCPYCGKRIKILEVE